MSKISKPSAAQRLEMAIVNHLTALEGQLSTFSKSEAEKVGALKRIMAAAEDTKQIQTETKETMQELVRAIKENTKAKNDQKAATKELVTQLKVAGLVAAKAQPAVAPPLAVVTDKPAVPVPAKGAPHQPAQQGPEERAPEKSKPKPAAVPSTSKPKKAPVAPLKKPVEQAEKPRKRRPSSSSSGGSSSGSSSTSEAEEKKKVKNKKAKGPSTDSDSPATIVGGRKENSGDESDALSTKAPSIPEPAGSSRKNSDLREDLAQRGGFLPKTPSSSRSRSGRESERRPMAPPRTQVRVLPMVQPRPTYRPTPTRGVIQYAPVESDGTDAEMTHYNPYYGHYDPAQAAYERERQQRGDLRRASAGYVSERAGQPGARDPVHASSPEAKAVQSQHILLRADTGCFNFFFL